MSVTDSAENLTSDGSVAITELHEEAGQRSQPLVGVLGLLIVAVVFALLSTVWSPQTSLVVLGPISTFALPVLVVSAIWWGGWPFARFGRSASGLGNTVMIAAAGVILTGVGLLIVGHFSVQGIFSSNAAKLNSNGVLTTFPFTIPIAATVFVTMLQLTFVSNKWPLHRVRTVSSGISAFVFSWVVGTAIYFLVTNWNSVPAAARTALGIRNGIGPMNAIDFTALLLCIVVYQMSFFVLFRGWPFTGIKSEGARLVASHMATIGGGWITFFVLLDGFKWQDPVIVGACGSIIGSIFLVGMLFETWPFEREDAASNRFGSAVMTVIVSCVLYFGLRALGHATGTWSQAPVELWIGVCGLNYIAAVIILHYAVWGRWPLEAPKPPNS
jgi:hypothetical protein